MTGDFFSHSLNFFSKRFRNPLFSFTLSSHEKVARKLTERETSESPVSLLFSLVVAPRTSLAGLPSRVTALPYSK